MFALLSLLLFWIPLALMVYNWFGFPLLLLLAARLRRERRESPPYADLPRATIAIAAWNEELSIGAKLQNCLEFDYPRDKVEILVGTDAVTDRTNEIASTFADRGVELCAVDQRMGKSAVLNMLVAKAHGELILFTDADVLLAPDALRLAVDRFRDEKVGVLLFRYQRLNKDGNAAEGLWDRYENRLKELEGRLGAAVGVYGWATMVRKSLCRPIPAETINDDYILGTRPFRWGYSAVYEPRALSWTTVEPAGVEFTRRTRISRGNIQSFFMMPDVFLPKYGTKAWVLFSHKFLRWFTPFLMLAMLAGSALMWHVPFFRVVLLLQLLVYASTPLVPVVRGVGRKLLFLQYFAWANVAQLVGYWQYFFGRRLAYNWLRTARR